MRFAYILIIIIFLNSCIESKKSSKNVIQGILDINEVNGCKEKSCIENYLNDNLLSLNGE